ncbi:hypothetical protein LZ30DRAFT_742622 [Colletotrichum cereale]|nr:hypothetical protein LZ30DRAFT_742622 [Colletotrichum cereale]
MYPYALLPIITTLITILIDAEMSSSDLDTSIASDDSITSTRSCIVVEVLLEDLTAACNTDCTLERCDAVTVRPYEPPATEHGPLGSFRPFDVPARA